MTIPHFCIRPSFISCLAALALLIGASTPARALPFQEVGGTVVVEAEHFDSKVDFRQWSWTLQNNGDDGFSNARGMFMRSLPEDSGINNGGAFPVSDNVETMDYKINITTTGEYQLFIRAGAPDGDPSDSDSVYVGIVELRDGPGDVVADFWEFTNAEEDLETDQSDFDAFTPDQFPNTNGWWDGLGGFENVSAADQDDPAVFPISNPGEYTVRIGRREDGVALDTFMLRLTSLTNPNELPMGGNEVELPESPQILEPSTIDGDYNNNLEVDLPDLNLVLFNWQVDGGDLTQDWINQRPAAETSVGLPELNGVLFNWGNTASVGSVPEPAAVMLTILGLLTLGIRRRGR